MVKVLQLKIQLKKFKSSMYRTIQVKDSDTFVKLHDYIQNLFGFQNCHLWMFVFSNPSLRMNDLEIKIPNEYDDDFDTELETLDARKTKLVEVFSDRGIDNLNYEYDFGDGWEFYVICENVLEPEKGVKYPIVLRGEGGYLIEDCGGVYGLGEMIESYKKGKPYLDWFEDFEQFKEYMEPFFEKVEWKGYEL